MRPLLSLMTVGIFVLMTCEQSAHGQGIERESLTGESVAEELRQSGDKESYNLKIGPVALRVDADMLVAYDDNINLNKSGRISDVIVTPEMTVHGRWEVSDLNALTFNVGLGYQDYVTHSNFNNVLLSPDSEASFNFFVGDLAFNLHEIGSYQQDPTQIGQLSNQTRLGRFQNDVGIGATWDLNDIVVELNYDHANLWVTQSFYDYLTNQSDTVAPKVTFHVNKTIQAGLNASFASTRYEKSFENDYQTITAGPFVTAQISEYLSATAQVGGYISEYDRGGQNGDNEDVASYYGSLGLNHRINDALSESLTLGREFIPGLTSNFTERIYANYSDSWQATSNVSLRGNLWWENLTDSNAAFRETSNRYGLALDADDNIAEHITISLHYQYILKDANPSELSYYENLGSVDVRYRF